MLILPNFLSEGRFVVWLILFIAGYVFGRG